MSIRRVLILGCKGTLGGQLMKLYPQATGWDREDIDVLDFAALRARVSALGFVPDAVINCVAFNDVDGAEDRPEKATALNELFPGELARFTREMDVPLVHYSTNYVFDGVQGEYVETDPPAPVSSYARSKWGGERRVAEAAGRSYIVRTAVLFGPKGESELSKKSFVDLMRDLASTRDTIQAVSDEINSITYAPDLAAATSALLDRLPEPGIYHLANAGAASWFDLAREIVRITGKTVNVLPVPASHFPRKARRPAKSVIINSKLPALRSWQEALAEFLGAEVPEFEHHLPG
jgi:dTDP-4-dehydrorhamnose reductase